MGSCSCYRFVVMILLFFNTTFACTSVSSVFISGIALVYAKLLDYKDWFFIVIFLNCSRDRFSRYLLFNLWYLLYDIILRHDLSSAMFPTLMEHWQSGFGLKKRVLKLSVKVIVEEKKKTKNKKIIAFKNRFPFKAIGYFYFTTFNVSGGRGNRDVCGSCGGVAAWRRWFALWWPCYLVFSFKRNRARGCGIGHFGVPASSSPCQLSVPQWGDRYSTRRRRRRRRPRSLRFSIRNCSSTPSWCLRPRRYWRWTIGHKHYRRSSFV